MRHLSGRLAAVPRPLIPVEVVFALVSIIYRMCFTGNQSEDTPYYSDSVRPSDDYYDYLPDLNELIAIANKDQIRMWMNEWREMIMDRQPESAIKQWYQNIKKRFGPHIIGHEECIKSLSLFSAEHQGLPQSGILHCQDECLNRTK